MYIFSKRALYDHCWMTSWTIHGGYSRIAVCFFSFTLVLTISSLFYAHPSASPKVCVSPDKVGHYPSSVCNSRASSLTQHMNAYRTRKLIPHLVHCKYNKCVTERVNYSIDIMMYKNINSLSLLH